MVTSIAVRLLLHLTPALPMLMVSSALSQTCRIILNLQYTHHHERTQQFSTDIYGIYGNADSFLLSDGPFERRGPC